jgi:hypothetical protein
VTAAARSSSFAAIATPASSKPRAVQSAAPSA